MIFFKLLIKLIYHRMDVQVQRTTSEISLNSNKSCFNWDKLNAITEVASDSKTLTNKECSNMLKIAFANIDLDLNLSFNAIVSSIRMISISGVYLIFVSCIDKCCCSYSTGATNWCMLKNCSFVLRFLINLFVLQSMVLSQSPETSGIKKAVTREMNIGCPSCDQMRSPKTHSDTSKFVHTQCWLYRKGEPHCAYWSAKDFVRFTETDDFVLTTSSLLDDFQIFSHARSSNASGAIIIFKPGIPDETLMIESVGCN